MKKIYSARRNALLTSRTISWGMGALLFSVAILCVRLLAPNLLWKAVSPAFDISQRVSVASHSFFARFDDAASLENKVAVLTEQNSVLAQENAALTSKLSAQDALAGSSGTRAPGIIASVAARPPMSPYDTLVLGSGANDGVALGMEAFGPSGVPVGVISSVLPDFSELTLFSSPRFVTDGWVGKLALPIRLIGGGAGSFTAVLSRSASIAVGDTVFVPGPGALPVGKVVHIDSDPFSAVVTLHVASAANPFSLTAVVLRGTGIRGFSFATSTLP